MPTNQITLDQNTLDQAIPDQITVGQIKPEIIQLKKPHYTQKTLITPDSNHITDNYLLS